MNVCKLCFKQHAPGACESFMAQQLRAKGVTSTGQFRQPIDLGPCPNCANYKAEIERLKAEVDNLLTLEGQKSRYGPVGACFAADPIGGGPEGPAPKMTQSERMKLRWAAKKAAEGKA